MYYTSEAAWPDAYEEYTVSAPTNYDSMFYTNRYAIADTMRINYTSPYEGTIQEICVSNGDYVQKGDVLLKVRTNEGSAKLAEMRSGIEDMKENRTKAVQAHENTLQSLQQEKQAALTAGQTPLATGTDAQKATDGDAEEQANPNLSSMLDVDIQIENLDFRYRRWIIHISSSSQRKHIRRQAVTMTEQVLCQSALSRRARCWISGETPEASWSLTRIFWRLIRR